MSKYKLDLKLNGCISDQVGTAKMITNKTFEALPVTCLLFAFSKKLKAFVKTITILLQA